MKAKKSIFIFTLILAMGLSLALTPMVGMAQTNTVPTTNDTTTWGLGLGLGQYYAGSMRDTVASTLGITVDELYSLRLEGNSLADISESKGVSSDDMLKVLIDAKTAQIEELYADGVITEEQRDYVLAGLQARMEYNMTKTTMGKGGGKGYRYNTNTDSSTWVPGQGKGGGMGAGWTTSQ